MESRDSCELDPSRLDRASDAHVNAEHLLVSACTGKLICQLTFGFSNSFYRNLLFVICPFPNFFHFSSYSLILRVSIFRYC